RRPYSALIPTPARSPLFPYTTLFRSKLAQSPRVSHFACAGTRVRRIGGVGRFGRSGANRSVVGRPPDAGTDGESLEPYVGKSGVDRKSTRLNSSHVSISYAVFRLKKK